MFPLIFSLANPARVALLQFDVVTRATALRASNAGGCAFKHGGFARFAAYLLFKLRGFCSCKRPRAVGIPTLAPFAKSEKLTAGLRKHSTQVRRQRRGCSRQA